MSNDHAWFKLLLELLDVTFLSWY